MPGRSAGHPPIWPVQRTQTWMAGTRPAVTERGVRKLGGLLGGSALGRSRGRLERDRFPTSAGARLVRIIEHETGAQPVGAVIHLGAEQEEHGGRVDQKLDAL